MSFEDQAALLWKFPDPKYASVSGMTQNAHLDLKWLKWGSYDEDTKFRQSLLRNLIEFLKKEPALGLTSENTYLRELTRLVNSKGL